ncbi:MAG: UpxY family transcription antiterminator [Terracidiphilus sp.]
MLEKASVLSPATAIIAGCQNLASSRKWFAVYTKCRHEKRVAQHLAQREIAHYLPLYRAERSWKSCAQVALDLPLFPGYVFVNISSSERVRALQVPGVVTLVAGLDGMPATISEEEIESLRTGLRYRCAEPYPYLTAGQRVRIRSGALAGIEGTVVRIKNGLRVVLTLDLIMQSFSVEVKSEELELLGPEPRAATGVV